jgi:hypothetical protein
MNKTDEDSTQQPVWEKQQEEQEQKVVVLARRFLMGSGSDLYRKTLSSFLCKRPRGLDRLEPIERDRLSQILNQANNVNMP